MSIFIYEKRNSISSELCNKIIEYYEGEENKYSGFTAKGLDENVKKTTDFSIPLNCFENNDEKINKWSKINEFLTSQLQENINEYMNSLKEHPNYVSDNYKFLHAKYLTEDTYQIQRYTKGEGKYVYHEDSFVDWENERYRVITFLWYLNDVLEGGETELLGDILIKPETGKLLLFPACWTFPHRGKMPISNDKYIITGWFYVNRNEDG